MAFDSSLLEEESSGFDPSLLEEEPQPTEEEILSRPGIPAWVGPNGELPGEDILSATPRETGLFGPGTPSWRDIRTSRFGHALLGPTELEREAGARPYNDPGIIPVAQQMMRMTSLPPPIANEIRTLTQPVIDLTPAPETVRGAAKGAQEVALTMPLAPLGPGAKIAMPLFAGEFAAGIPERKREYERAIMEGRFEDAAKLGTEFALEGALIGGGTAHTMMREAPARTAAGEAISEAAAERPERFAEPNERFNPNLEEIKNASGKQETAAVHGDLRTPAGEGAREMPESQSSAGVQPQAGERLPESSGGAPRNEPTPAEGEVSLSELPEKVASMSAQEFMDWTKTLPEGGQTRQSFNVARESDPQTLGELKDQAAKEADAKWTEAKAETNMEKKLALMNDATVLANKVQFFTEARDYALADPKTSGGQRAIEEGFRPNYGPYSYRPLSEYQGEIPPDAVPVKIQREDGSTYDALLRSEPGSKYTKIGRIKPSGQKGDLAISDSGIGKGETIVEGPKTPAEYNAAVEQSAPVGDWRGRASMSWGIIPIAEPHLRAVVEGAKGLGGKAKDIWESVAIKSAPRMTKDSQALGEKAVRYASSYMVGRAKGQIFADKVLEGTGVDSNKFGAALTEDNLRSVKAELEQQLRDVSDPSRPDRVDPDKAELLQDAIDNVKTLIGERGSPFANEAEYQAFLSDPTTQAAIENHKRLWEEQKDPLFRQANDLDPDLELASRGLQTGARINLKAIREGDIPVAAIGRSTNLRQLGTLKRRDPFARQAKGSGRYESNYHEIMANGFEKELPVATQHEFIKAMIDSGNARVTDNAKSIDLKGEETKGYLLNLNPWRGKFLQVRKGLQPEYESISGLVTPAKLPYITAFNDFMTRQSVVGLAEGTTHASNLLTQIFTGPGPTANPLINALIKSMGRVDLLYQIPRVLLKAYSNQRARMVELAEIGAAKEPYPGKIASKILNPIDQGVRLVSDDIYKAMAEKGWVENSETARREFINQVGQYNKKLQPKLTRMLRESGVQPFMTATQTFTAQGLRRLALSPGVKATNAARALALKADIGAGWLGAVGLIVGLNMLLSGKATGPAGTPLGAVGWVGDDKKVHNFNVLRLLGYERGLRATGIGPYAQARMQGLKNQQALSEAGKSVASTGLGMLAGPGPRAAFVGATGLRPTQPWVQEAPRVPPGRSQVAENMKTAIIEANPVIASGHDVYKGLKEGKPISEIAQKIAEKQGSRFSPRTGMREETAQKLPKIVDTVQLREYVDQIAKDARKLPLNQRSRYIQQRFKDDGLDKKYRPAANEQINRKGVLKYR